jgi:hypothetical protein
MTRTLLDNSKIKDLEVSLENAIDHLNNRNQVEDHHHHRRNVSDDIELNWEDYEGIQFQLKIEGIYILFEIVIFCYYLFVIIILLLIIFIFLSFFFKSLSSFFYLS